MPTFSKGTKILALKETKGRCGYCSVGITLASCELDHVIPKSRMGTGSRKKNLLAACVGCNRAKSGMRLKDFKEKIGVGEFLFERLGIVKGEINLIDEDRSTPNITICKPVLRNPYEV